MDTRLLATGGELGAAAGAVEPGSAPATTTPGSDLEQPLASRIERAAGSEPGNIEPRPVPGPAGAPTGRGRLSQAEIPSGCMGRPVNKPSRWCCAAAALY